MPIRRRAAEAGIIQPADLEMLGRVFDATGEPEETEAQREDRAAAILRLFQKGTTDEDALTFRLKEAGLHSDLNS